MSNQLSNVEVADIFRRYGHLLLRRCRQRLRDDVAADDVLQEVFVKLIRHGGAYAAAESKLQWLYRVADNCCFDAIAQRRRRPVSLPAETVERIGHHQPAMETRLEAAAALRRLPTPDRQVAVLAFVGGLPQDRVATELGWSRQTINKKLKAIRARLGRWGHGR